MSAAIRGTANRIRHSAQPLILLGPVVWLTAGVIFFVATRVLSTSPTPIVGILILLGSMILWLRNGQRVFAALGIPALDVPALLMAVPWGIANSRQLLPIWNDSAHYAHSASKLFNREATLSQVMAISGSQDIVSGDFHGPMYIFLHWPIGFVQTESVRFATAALIAYACIALLKTIAVIFCFQALRAVFGLIFAALFIAGLFVLPWTSGLLTGTHREWIVLYAIALTGMTLRSHPKDVPTIMYFTSALVFAQAHITLALLIFAFIVTWAIVYPKELRLRVAVSQRRAWAVLAGLFVGYAPLGLRLATGTVSGVASYDGIAAFAPQAVELFDASRRNVVSLGVFSMSIPSLPRHVIAIVSLAIASSVLILRFSHERRSRFLSSLFLVYAFIFFMAMRGLIDATVGALGVRPSWFSLEKLLTTNDRYWFALALGALLVVGLALWDWEVRRRPSLVSDRTWTHGLVLIVPALYLAPVVTVLVHAGDSFLSQRFMPGRGEWPVYGFLVRMESVTGVLYRTLGILILLWFVSRIAGIHVQEWTSMLGTRAASMSDIRERIPFANKEALVALFVAILLLPVAVATPRMGYGHGTTAEAYEMVNFWENLVASADWDSDCWLASSSSSTQAFVALEGKPHYRLNAEWASHLWRPVQSSDDASQFDWPCAIFPGGFIDFSPANSSWRLKYTEVSCDRLGFCLYADPDRVSLSSTPIGGRR